MKKNDKYSLKLLKCFQVYCQQVIFKVLKDLYYHHPKSENGKLNIEEFNVVVRNVEYCKLVKNIVTDFPENFELNYSSGSDSHTNLETEVCLNFIILILYHDPKYLPVIIREEVKKLIELGNKLRHKNLEINDLEKCKHDLLKCMENICEAVGGTYNKKDKYQKLFCDTERLVNKIWDFDEDKFALQCRENVIKIYRNLFEKGINKSFFEEVFNESPKRFANPLLLVPSNNYPHRSINLKNVFKGNRVAVITGEAGYGKSTICKMLIFSWLEQKPFSNYDLVLLIDVKNVREGATLYQYLTQILFKGIFIVEDEDFTYFFFRNLRILFIIDDYDEMSDYSRVILDSLFKSFKDTDSQFLFTTKHYFSGNLLEQLKVHLSDDDLLSINLLGIENMKDLYPYLKPCVSKEIAYKLSIDLKKNIKVPSVITMLLYVNHHHKNMEKFRTLTMTSMYIQIHKYQKEVLLSNAVEKNSKLISELYLKIYKYCFEVYQNNDSKTFFIDNVLLNFSNSGIVEQFLKTLFKSSLNLWNIDHNPFDHYEMIHESFCAFFAAYHIFLLIDKKENLRKIFSSNLLKHKEVIYHLVGILYYEKKLFRYLDSLINILNKVFENECNKDIGLLWEILCQTMIYSDLLPDREICNRFGTYKLLPLDLKLNDETIECGISLLSFIDNYSPETIDIEFKNEELNKVNFDTLKGKGKLKNTKLKLKTNYNKSGSHLPAFFNSSFIRLVEFNGPVNKDDLHILMQFESLRNLTIKLNLDVLKNLIAEIGDTTWKSLIELRLLFKSPFKEKLDGFGSLNLVQKTKIVIEFLEEKDLRLTVSSLKILKNITKKKLTGVIIRIDKNLENEKVFKNVKKHFIELKDIVEEYLVIRSKIQIHHSLVDQLESELENIKFSWSFLTT